MLTITTSGEFVSLTSAAKTEDLVDAIEALFSQHIKGKQRKVEEALFNCGPTWEERAKAVVEIFEEELS